MSRAAWLSWLPLLCAVGGCGKGVVPGTAHDQAMKSYIGTVFPAGGLAQTRPLVGVLWTDPLQRKPDVFMPARSMRSGMYVDEMTKDDKFTLDLFRPPPPEVMVEIAAPPPWHDSVELAIAEIVLVDDVNGDGRFELADKRDDGGNPVGNPRAELVAPDRYLAGSVTVLTYVARPYATIPQGGTVLTLPGQVGYALVNYRCQGRISGGVDPIAPWGIGVILQPSPFLPEVRGCARTHSP